MNKGAAFVVGGSGGLGSAICRTLAPEWEAMIVGFRSSPDAAEAVCSDVAGTCTAVPMRCDLRDMESIATAISEAATRFGRIGTMVFAGGVQIAQPFVSKIDETDWREVIETELIGFTRIVSATLPRFRKQGGGNFVSVVSVANYSYPPGDALSSVPKAGIEALGRAIAKEEGRYGVRANMVAPGIIDAGLGASFLKDLYTPEIWETQRRRIALQRFGTGEEIAEAVAFLASERARYITGQTLIVDGGFSL
jgi:NAD(P)-dependent dehydrogenase (short-subunit alcohol dehydrogenase family)